MSIPKLPEKFKRHLEIGDVILMVLMIAFGAASFYLGRLSAINSQELIMPELHSQSASLSSEITDSPHHRPATPQPDTPSIPHPMTTKGMYVGSKNGTKYHLPWCSGAQRIKEENKIWFTSKEEAEQKGYTPAANCKGI